VRVPSLSPSLSCRPRSRLTRDPDCRRRRHRGPGSDDPLHVWLPGAGARALPFRAPLALLPRLTLSPTGPAQAFWYPDVTLLAGYIVGFTVLSYVALVAFVKERR